MARTVFKLYKKIKSIEIITLSIVVFSLIATFYIILLEVNNYHSLQRQYQNNAERELNVIAQMLNLTFEYTNHINTNIGRQIVTNGYVNTTQILESLSNPLYKQYNKTLYFSWSLFDWVDNKNLQQVNSQVGIRNPAPDMSMREYTYLSPKHPWTLQFAKPTIGNPSQKFVIPAGTGITNSDGKYIGAVVIGFVVEDLIKQIQQFTNNSALGFVLEGADGTEYLKYGNDTEYLAENKPTNYPFTLKVGFKKGSMQKEFLQNLWHDILKMAFGMIFLAGILIVFRRTLKKKDLINEKHAISKESLLLLSKNQLNSMKEQVNKAIKRLNDNMIEMEQEGISDNKKESMYAMIGALYNIRNTLFSTTKTHLKSVNLDNIVQSVLNLKAVEILEAGLQVNTEVNIKEEVQLDEVKITQLLSFTILYIISIGSKSLTITTNAINNVIQISFKSSNIVDDSLMDYIEPDGIDYFYIRDVIYFHKADIECKNGEILLTIAN